jgi:hypothetical protein
MITRRTFTLSAAGLAAGLAAAPAGADADWPLHVDDLRLYDTMMNSLAAGADRRAAADWYYQNAGPGHAAYRRVYSVTPGRFAERLGQYPGFYRALSGAAGRVLARREEIVDAMRGVRRLVPATPLVPVYFFIGVMGHGATPREIDPEGGEQALGLLIPAELTGFSDDTDMSEFPEGRQGRGGMDDLAGLVAHELTHVSQIHLQGGLERYRRIYVRPGWGTHAAFAIREGGADLAAWLAAGALRDRHRHARASEDALWRAFEPVLDAPARDGAWFSHAPGSGLFPAAGYGLGWLICRRYYEAAEDKDAALHRILSASAPSDFQAIVGAYAAGFPR